MRTLTPNIAILIRTEPPYYDITKDPAIFGYIWAKWIEPKLVHMRNRNGKMKIL